MPGLLGKKIGMTSVLMVKMYHALLSKLVLV
jgi:ribosomal protein L3